VKAEIFVDSLHEQHGKRRRPDISDNSGLDNGIYRLLKTINTTQMYFTILPVASDAFLSL